MKSRYDRLSAAERQSPCLLELVSKLAREPWTDHPSCVHPTLGSIARAVHDHSSISGRLALREFAPAFVNTAHAGFGTSARLVALCVSNALASPRSDLISNDERRRLELARRTALFLMEGKPALAGPARWWFPVLDRVGLSEPFYRTYVSTEHAAEAVAVTAKAAGAGRDAQLRRLLKLCLSSAPPPRRLTLV
ncbi:hypothetical protein OG394_15370 [Kribbella sp. NBC_01245]|uniref:hypothetical protein n=1 Tax=Kribbella sp. NBC_01245 TaxID=2903578 RepID=UPI002E285C8C|nr:hypothetical protein [Kribbella sp. NBC_01245]